MAAELKADRTIVLRVENLSKTYFIENIEVCALCDVSFSVAEGEFVSIMGQSGSGKSTLMNMLGGLDRPTEGKIFIDEQETGDLSDNQLARLRNEKIGFVFQTFNLLPRTEAVKNVALPLVYAGVNSADRAKRAQVALERVGLGNRLHHKSSQLSGGQQQRVAIARALINNPAVILADEPTGNLDSKSGSEIMKLLKDLHDEGKTIVLITHERYVAEHAERIVTLFDGKIVSEEQVKYGGADAKDDRLAEEPKE